MKTHTIGFKNAIKQFGKEISSKITYTINNSQQILNNDDLNSISYHYNGDILKSVMKQLDIDSNIDIPLNTLVNFQFGVKVNGSYEYLNYGNFIVYKSEKQEDTNSYKLTCYDKLLYSMIDYETPKVSGTAITYPITIRNYLGAICSHLGLTFANSSDTFTNYDKEIPSELYLDNQGGTLGYTFRDVLDELAEVTASIICINDNNELEVRYFRVATPSNFINLPNYTKTSGRATITTNGRNLKVIGNFNSAIEHSITDRKIEQDIETGSYTFSISEAQSNLTIIIRLYKDNTQITSQAISAGRTSQTITLSQNVNSYEIFIVPSSVAVSFDVNINFSFNLSNNVDVINEEMLKDVNVNFSEQYGPINTVVFSRSGGADKIALSNPQNLSDSEKKPIVIEDNQILNGNDRSDYLQPLLERLYGLNYYINDFSSTGIAYLELGDVYNVKIGNNTYQCLLLNDELNISQGLEENIYTDLSEQAEVDYKTASKTDKMINKTNLIVDKVNSEISGVITRVSTLENTQITTTQMNNAITQKIDDNNNNYIASQISNAITTADGHTDDKLENYPTSTEVTNEITQKIDANNNTYTSVELAKKVNGSDITKAYLMLKLTNNRSDAALGADEISLSANDVLNLIAGNTINLTSKNIIISSDNFSADANGYVTMTGATINGKIKASEFTGNNENVKLQIGSDSDGYANTDNTVEIKASDNFLNLSIFCKRFSSNIQATYFKTDASHGFYFLGQIQTNGDINVSGNISANNIDSGHDYGANSNTWLTVYFNKTFTYTPHVTVTPNTTTAGVIVLKIKDVTTTKFDVIVGGSGYSNIDFDWIAIG